MWFVSKQVNSWRNKQNELSFIAGQFMNTLDNYEITIPLRVTEGGDVISKDLHPHSLRHRRNSDQLSDAIHYKLNVKDSDYVLKLKPNTKFFHPSLVVETRRNSFNNVSDSVFVRYTGSTERPCHYTGEILDRSNSKVALALCDGLVSAHAINIYSLCTLITF